MYHIHGGRWLCSIISSTCSSGWYTLSQCTRSLRITPLLAAFSRSVAATMNTILWYMQNVLLQGYIGYQNSSCCLTQHQSANYLGTRGGIISVLKETETAPLLKLAKSLKENKRKCQKTNNCGPVVPCYLEPDIANCMAPDHLLSGTVKGLVYTTFARTRNMRYKRKLDISLCTALWGVEVHENPPLFKVEIDMIHSMGISTLFCWFPMILWSETQVSSTSCPSTSSPATLVALTYCWFHIDWCIQLCIQWGSGLIP